MKTEIILLVLIASGLLVGCSENRTDPLSAGLGTLDYGGALTMGQNRPNILVNEDNKWELCRDIFDEIFPSFEKSRLVHTTSPTSENTVRILGDYYGYAIIDSPADTTISGETVTSLKVTYYDYSEFGVIYIGGMIGFTGTVEKQGSRSVPKNIVLAGEVAFAGDYSGSIEFVNFQLFFDSEGELFDVVSEADSVLARLWCRGYVKIVSGDKKIWFNPFYREPQF